MDDVEPELHKALMRYEVISAYLAMDPPRGQKKPLLKQLASRVWTGSDGEPLRVSAETIRVWVRRYRKKGLDGLRDKPRPARGCQALTAEQAELAVKLKREVPERSLDRLIAIMEDMKLIEPDVVKRSTLHRVLQSAGVSRLRGRVPDRQDLDRFEAEAPNALWQSDMLVGPWLPDPERPGKMRRAYLYAFLDDHSRLLLHGRFSFKGDLPALELVFRRCLQKFGVCVRVYYDNGQTYRSRHMRQIVATLGIHPIIFTKTYRPMGHGKIEKLNELIRAAFLAELKASNITTLDQLNEAFGAWADHATLYTTKLQAGYHCSLPRIRSAPRDGFTGLGSRDSPPDSFRVKSISRDLPRGTGHHLGGWEHLRLDQTADDRRAHLESNRSLRQRECHPVVA